MSTYRRHVNEAFRQNLRDTKQLHRWSCDSPHDFWKDLYGYLGLQPPLRPSMKKAYDDNVPMSSNPPFFPNHEINYTENAIFANTDPEAVALIGIQEGEDVYAGSDDIYTWHQFREKVRQVASALRRSGIKKGDRVGALVAASNWAVILFHATAAIGAIFTSISPELGLEGCVSRLTQVTPSILFVDSHAIYKGKAVSTANKLERIATKLSPRPEIFVIPTSKVQASTQFSSITQFLARSRPSDPLTFTRVPFSYPLLICYSSGTTGAPKCIVHQHGLIIQVKKISTLHNGLGPGDVVMQYSSTSWVVFYVMTGHFSVGATLCVYNGSPLYPDSKQLLRICDKYRVTFLGASPRLLLEIEMAKVIPKKEFDLSALRIVYTTGATLGLEQYRWFYRVFPPSVHICNTAGGTDTATSLIALDPCGPVYEGEMQVYGLGMDVDVADPITGESIAHTGQAGEMIVRKPFPSMPCFFWGDTDGKKYREAYFERFDNIDVWAQHDWLSQNPKTGGLMMHGRSDGVLNPSGIRFGSGEIYSIVEAEPFTQSISNTLCVGRRRPSDGDEQVFLFVVMKPGETLEQDLRRKIKDAVRNGLSARHVPGFVLQVPDIPVTINGKKIEIAVKQVISGKDVVPSATVQNPESLKYFERFRTLESEPKETKL
jgi:acetoacetyl-CoA synthetase